MISIFRWKNTSKCLHTSIRKKERVRPDYIENIDSNLRTVGSKKAEPTVDSEVSLVVELQGCSEEVKTSMTRMWSQI